MEYRKLGNSGALVSALALGTMNFGTPETPEDEAFAQLDAFIEAGGNLIDTAGRRRENSRPVADGPPARRHRPHGQTATRSP
jgi:predicted aldo/keto reductase-like oxidoreductase